MNVSSFATWIAAVLVLFLFPGMSAVAQSPNPPFPVGHLTGSPVPTGNGTAASLIWSTHRPLTGDYVFFVRQIQTGDVPMERYITVEGAGEALSWTIDPWGSRFELWAIETSSFREYLLDATVVSPYVPTANVTIRSEDPYAILPRTRADRPFYVDVTVQGISNEENAPDISKGATLIQHVQAYGEMGAGTVLNRTEATLVSQSPITTNGTQTLTFATNEIPGANFAKARGEERFSVYSLDGYEMPSSVISSKFIQVWPVADGSITGISEGQVIGVEMPLLIVQLNDLYPRSDTWVQVYKGSPQPNAAGTMVPDSLITVDDSVPPDQWNIGLIDYDSLFDSDGLWTMELLTRTPFGTDRLAHVSFTVQRGGTALERWRQVHFGSMLNSGPGWDDWDFDEDGLPNILEFAFGSDPKKNSAGLLPKARVSGNNLLIDFTQPEGVSGVTYGAEWSTTLLPDSWVPVSDTGTLSQHLFSVPIDAKPQLFMRLKVTK